jgi:hypothetical protein
MLDLLGESTCGDGVWISVKGLLQVGLGPFVVSIPKDVPRFGPTATPLPNVGAFYVPLTGGLYFVVCNAKASLRPGIGLQDVRSYYGTDAGTCRQR